MRLYRFLDLNAVGRDKNFIYNWKVDGAREALIAPKGKRTVGVK